MEWINPDPSAHDSDSRIDLFVLWFTALATLLVFYARNPRVFGTTRLPLDVVAIHTLRNIVENIYLGVYFGRSGIRRSRIPLRS